MSGKTGIEWTDATWNPVTGCTKVSSGCDHCYAETLAHRLLKDRYRAKLPIVNTEANRRDPFAVRIWPDRLAIPGGWTGPKLVFVNSMSDLFHRDVPELFVRDCFDVMLREDRHTYQILTKRPARAAAFVNSIAADLFPDGLPAHIWIGTSIENEAAAYRIRHLLDVRATVRFLSCEPLIGPIRLEGSGFERGIHWVIVGGESGPKRRAVDERWVRTIRTACVKKGIPFFFKQWGGRTPKANGRRLEGREWNEMPEAVTL